MAYGVFIAHNHPSGNLLPSKSDESLTEKIKYAPKLIDVKLIDHVNTESNLHRFGFLGEDQARIGILNIFG
jgi:DNA repair protein RadC